MPADSGMAFVVVQHLDPSHASILTDILQRSTPMPVIEAQDRMPVAANRVHVIPPNRDMLIENGALRLSVPSEPRSHRMPIDAFLRSLAAERGEAAVGIVLSGTGTDGTLGLRDILGAGGLTLVQDPATARYDGMPASAIKSGYVTQVLPAEEMPQALLTGTRALPQRPSDATARTPEVRGGLGKVLALLRSTTGHDFSQYKKSTIGRRIERRMVQQGIDSADVYGRYLKEHAAEVGVLFRELLINVTSFFRDPQAFDALRQSILPEMLAGKPEGYVLRVWVAGCATGEEAYSIAMLLREVLDEAHRDLRVQIYATDLDDDAIARARTGLYPPNIAQDVSPDRLRRHFVAEDAGYRVKKEIREMVVFAVQSVIKDPPFTRLDLLACRNLLIYLEPELQNRLIPAFHYALKPGGVLFLSPSESIGGHTDLFEPIERRWKFYRARPTIASTRALLNGGLSWAADSVPADAHEARGVKALPLAEIAKRTLLQAFAPAAVVTDLQGNILYVHGETGKFLRPAPGQPTHNVVEMAREALAPTLREALHQAAAQGVSTLNRSVDMRVDGKPQPVSLSVRALPETDGSHAVLLVSFQEVAVAVPPEATRARRGRSSSTGAAHIAALERELAQAREHMGAMLEEHQAINEELKSTNEELQSTNEELQSTNEELETSKEELQSVNEELVTVNSELQTKIEQMGVMQDDMKNLLENIRLGTIFLDRHLAIRRFTREAVKVFRLVPADVGRPLADIRSELQGVDLLADAQAVLDSLVPIERETCTTGGTWYLARIQPYRTMDNVIDGVVLTFADITERVQATAARQARELAEAIVDTVRDPLVILDAGLHVMSANAAFYRQFGGAAHSTVGRPLFEIEARRWDFPALRELLEITLPREHSFEDRRVDHEFAGLGMRRMSLSARRVVGKAAAHGLLLLAIRKGAAS